MKIRLFLVLTCLLLSSSREASAVLTQDQAVLAAKNIWGSAAVVRKSGRNYQVGCVVSNTVIVAGASKDSWDDALSKVNRSINGPHVLTAEARGLDGGVAVSDPVTVILCNP